MTEKLEYLDKLKNNMGEEMAEMMSEEITKVMDEQRDMEQTYARLITERGELKGISNKHKLHDTIQQIQVSIKKFGRLRIKIISMAIITVFISR